jgi:hypothetical protein
VNFQPNSADHRGRLSLLFNGSVVTQPLGARATYGDLAAMLDRDVRLRHGNPIAINVVMACPAPQRHCSDAA